MFLLAANHRQSHKRQLNDNLIKIARLMYQNDVSWRHFVDFIVKFLHIHYNIQYINLVLVFNLGHESA